MKVVHEEFFHLPHHAFYQVIELENGERTVSVVFRREDYLRCGGGPMLKVSEVLTQIFAPRIEYEVWVRDCVRSRIEGLLSECDSLQAGVDARMDEVSALREWVGLEDVDG